MKKKILSLFILLGLSSAIHAFSKSELYEDSYNINQKRLLFGKERIHEITRGKIDYDYDPSKGVYCKAIEDLYSKEFIFKIPEKYISCSPDIFPFVFELKDAIYQSVSKVNNLNETKAKTGMFLMSYHLMLLFYQNRTEIFDEVVRLNKNYYNVIPANELLDYVDSLPRSVYSRDYYDDKEYTLLEMLGFQVEKILQYREVQEKVLSLIKVTVSERTFNLIKPWLSDWEMFRYCNALIASRAYRATLFEYANFRKAQLTEEPGASQQKKMFNDNFQDGPVLCMIPFVDLCNHKLNTNPDHRDTTDFVTKYDKDGYVKIAVYSSFKKGQDYQYTYVGDSSNLHLLLTYGFYIDNNPVSTSMVNIPINKNIFPRSKHNLCKKLKCFATPFDNFYDSSNLETANVQISLSKKEIPLAVIRFFKLLRISNEEFMGKEKEIARKLKREQWISYENEVTTYAFLREHVLLNMNKYPINYEDAIYAIHNTRKFYKENAELFKNNKFQRFKYRLRRKIMIVGKEKNWILMKNIQLAQKEIVKTQQDQFRKLRDFYVESNNYF